MKVKSTRTTIFPKLGWSIRRGRTKELPKDPAAQKAILVSSFITPVDSPTPKERSSNRGPAKSQDSDD